MSLLADQLLLLGAVGSLAAGAWRLAGGAMGGGGGGLLHAVAAAPVAASAAVLGAAGLGLVGLGATPAALFLAAAMVWLGARALLRASGGRVPVCAQLTRWWGALGLPGRLGRGALGGVLVAYLVWMLRHPGIGLDGLADHLALPVQWVHDGRPGSVVTVNDAFAFGSFPITHEVLVAWLVGLAHTLVPAMLATPATLVLLVASVRVGLGELDLSPRLSWLAAAVAATLPIVVVQLPGPNNDLPAAAWLVCAAALVAASWRRSPLLLAPALLAAGLAIGTKATPALLLGIVVAAGLWRLRDQRAAVAAPRVALSICAAVVVALLSGGFWYLRDLVQHGSPLWPLQAFPGSDPVPAPLRAIDPSFLTHFRATLHGRVGMYLQTLAGGTVALGGAVLAPLWAGWRAFAAATCVLAALLLWAASPYTGNWNNTALALGATRYLLPCLLAATVAVAVAGRGREWPSLLILGVAVALNLARGANLGFPAAPAAVTLLLAGAAGAVVTLGAGRLRRIGSPARVRRVASPLLLLAVAAASLAALLIPVGGFMAAHAGTGQADAGLVRWLESRAEFDRGREPVAIAPAAIASLTGARLAHPLVVLGPTEDCATVARRRRSGWLVLETGGAADPYAAPIRACLAGLRPVYAAAGLEVYAPPALSAPAS